MDSVHNNGSGSSNKFISEREIRKDCPGFMEPSHLGSPYQLQVKGTCYSGSKLNLRRRICVISCFLQVISLSESQSPIKSINIDEDATSYIFRELTPGATYQVQLFSVFDNKESVAYTSRNFTTSKSTS